jgi:hypothetical protein
MAIIQYLFHPVIVKSVTSFLMLINIEKCTTISHSDMFTAHILDPDSIVASHPVKS